LHVVKKQLVHKALFSQQLAEYKAWCSNLIQLDRPGCAHSLCTWQNFEKHIFLLLGHCHHYHQVSMPTMQLFFSSPLIWHFASFHIAAKQSHFRQKHLDVCQACVEMVADQAWRQASQFSGGASVAANTGQTGAAAAGAAAAVLYVLACCA